MRRTARRRSEPAGRRVDLEIGEPFEQTTERHPTLEAGGRGAEAVVGAVSEAENAIEVTAHVEVVDRAAELSLVAVGRAVEQDHLGALGDRRVVDRDVAGRRAGQVLDRRGQPQELVDGRPDA